MTDSSLDAPLRLLALILLRGPPFCRHYRMISNRVVLLYKIQEGQRLYTVLHCIGSAWQGVWHRVGARLNKEGGRNGRKMHLTQIVYYLYTWIFFDSWPSEGSNSIPVTGEQMTLTVALLVNAPAQVPSLLGDLVLSLQPRPALHNWGGHRSQRWPCASLWCPTPGVVTPPRLHGTWGLSYSSFHTLPHMLCENPISPITLWIPAEERKCFLCLCLMLDACRVTVGW